MTRLERIALNKALGLSAKRFEEMTDRAYEEVRDFEAERRLKTQADVRGIKPNAWPKPTHWYWALRFGR